MKHAPLILTLCAATLAATCSAPARPRPHEQADRSHPHEPAKQQLVADTAERPPLGAERLPHEVDLTGRWATGSTGEPTLAKIVLQPSCRITPAAWILQQRGDTIEAWNFPESYAQGISRGPSGPATDPSHGRISGLNVVLRDAESRYVLRYDTSSGHLRGTKNGVLFWAVRQEIVRIQDCPPVP
jgi:hypothetical protein